MGYTNIISYDIEMKHNGKPRHEFSLTYGPQMTGDYRDTWQVFRIMSEFVSGYQFLSEFKNAVTVFGSARTAPQSRYYQDAVDLGRLLGKHGFTTVTGGGPGIMEAANRGATEASGDSIGLNIQLPYEQRINKYVGKSTSFSYFFSRKAMLSAPSQAFVFYPGGFGTLDEEFEVLDNIELHLADQIPIILIGKEFWEPLLDFLLKNSVKKIHSIDEEDVRLIKLVDNAEEAFEIIKKTKPSKNCSTLSASTFACGKEINWRIFQIMAEVVGGLEFLTGLENDVTVLGTKSIRPDSPYYKAAYEIGKYLGKKKYVLITGGGSGVMEAANKGAYEQKGESIGLYTNLPADQGPVNKYLTRSLSFKFSYVRKLILTAPSKAFILFPGGFGTMDQCFEVLTLIQTEKMKQVPVILYSKEFWNPLIAFLKENVFEDRHAINHHDLKLFNVVDSVEEVINILEEIDKK